MGKYLSSVFPTKIKLLFTNKKQAHEFVCVFYAVSRRIKRFENISNDGTHLLLDRVLCVCVVSSFLQPHEL